MAFEKYTERMRHVDRPVTLSIHTGSSPAYLSAGAIEEYFQTGGGVANHITYYTDREQSKLGISVGESGEDAFKVSQKDSGASISIRGTLSKAFGVDVDDLEESWEVDLEKDAESGLVVVDISDLVEAVTGDRHCPECGKRFTAQGLQGHITSIHDNPREILEQASPDDVGDTAPEGDDSYQEYYNGGESA